MMYATREERDLLFRTGRKYEEVRVLNESPTGFGWAVLVRDRWENGRLKVVKLPNREEATRELENEISILVKISEYLRHKNLISLHAVERYIVQVGSKEEP